MNKTQIRAALKWLSERSMVSQFSQRHNIARRTICRVKKRGSSPSVRTLALIEKAIVADRKAGILEDGQ